MKNVEICLKVLKSVSGLHKSTKINIKSENDTYPNISQIKTENIELNYGCEDTDKRQLEAIVHEKTLSQVDSRSQYTLIVQDEKLLDPRDCENDGREGEASDKRHIKQELDLDTRLEEYDFDKIGFEDESSTDIVKCPACSYECRIRETVEKHMNESHMEDQMCKVCNEEFDCKPMYNSFAHFHVNRTEGSLKSTNIKHHKCKVCSKIFGRKYDLKRHLITHTGEKPFKCKICPKTFRDRSHLARHLRCHTGTKPFKCQICMKEFRQNTNLTRHLRSHTEERPFKCEVCPKAFNQKHHLEAHLSCHTGEKLFKCEICPKTFGAISNLSHHLKCHTGERPFKCEICMKEFRRKTNLTDHLKCHTGERPFNCEICRKAFSRKTILREHLRSHTGSRPFKCEICMKDFGEKSTLTRHLKCHTGERPFKCEICPKTYKRKTDLKFHLKKHAENNARKKGHVREQSLPGSQVDPKLKDTSVLQYQGDNLGIRLFDQPDCSNDIMDGISATQDIKNEPEFDICMEEDVFEEI